MGRVGLIDITVGNAARLGVSQRSTTRRCASHHIATQRASRWGHLGSSRAFGAEGPPQARKRLREGMASEGDVAQRAACQIVLALEIEASRRPADGAAGNTRADPRDEYRQSTLGSATNSWRASQARHRNRTDQRRQVYGQAERPAVPRLEDVPPQYADGIAAMDLFVVPTISFRLLYGLLIMGMVDDRFYGVALPRIRPQNGSQIRSRKLAAGRRPLAI